MFRVERHGKNHEIAGLECGSSAEPLEQTRWRADDAEIHVLRRARALDTKLHDEASLEYDGIAELMGNAREKAREDEELTPSGEVDTAR
jgi:hypothetical protein